tara:strand:- start:235 stop:918 length:684 start_codon:yes stop_codon:yes gene_type:complete
MAYLDEFYRILESDNPSDPVDYSDDDSLMDAPAPGFGRQKDPIYKEDLMFNQLDPAGQNKITDPLVNYHNAMNNVMMSGPAREGRETIRVGGDERDTYPYGTMGPTFPEIPQTEDYNLNYYPGEFDQINAAFRNRAGISQEQSSGYKDPNMIPGFKLTPGPSDFQTINNAAGLPAMPVDVRGQENNYMNNIPLEGQQNNFINQQSSFDTRTQTGILDDLKAFAGIFK